jgi:hypothetical protein
MLSILSGVMPCQRKISYRVAHFIRFRDQKVSEFCSIIDSFDAAEQVLGHAIDTSQRQTASDPVATGDLIPA